MIHAAFFMEQHIGHRSYYQNLREVIDKLPQIQASWVPITYDPSKTLWNRLPLWFPRLQGAFAGRTEVRQGLRQTTRCDVALFNTQVPAVLGGSVVKEQPYVLCTDITPIQYDEMADQYGHEPDGDNAIGRWKHKANVETLQGAQRILPWSSWTAASLIEDYGVDPERIEIVAPGVDLEVWRPDSDYIPEKTLKILFVGGDLMRKGGDVLLNAFRSLPHGVAELHLVTRTELPAEAGVTVYNHLQPNTPELIELYQKSDVFVLPTKAEAFGIAAIEASAAGLPVIATAVGGLVDIVVEGKTGFFIEPGDAPTLARRLQQLAKNIQLRQTLGEAARQRAEHRFDSKTNAGRIAEVLQEVVVETKKVKNDLPPSVAVSGVAAKKVVS